MTKSKNFRLNTLDLAEIKLICKFYNCNETSAIRHALKDLANKLATKEELNEAIDEILTSECLRDRSED